MGPSRANIAALREVVKSALSFRQDGELGIAHEGRRREDAKIVLDLCASVPHLWQILSSSLSRLPPWAAPLSAALSERCNYVHRKFSDEIGAPLEPAWWPDVNWNRSSSAAPV